MLRLPHDRLVSRGPLKAFAITISALAGITSAGAAPRGRRLLTASVVIAAGTLPVLHEPRLAEPAYHAWDRAAERVAHAATAYVAWLTHVTAVRPAPPRAGSDGVHPTNGAWTAVLTQHQAAAHGPWLRICLAVLRWVRPSHDAPDADVPTDVYTLY